MAEEDERREEIRISEDNVETLDLSNRSLKKLEKNNGLTPQAIILDNNSLARLDNVDTYGNIQKLCVVNNELIRMYGISKLTNLRVLNLAENNIVCIEGLKEVVHLSWLNLAGNNIKSIDHLNTNIALEYLDLSDNNITHLSDVSCLKLLTTFFLHKNNITTLRFASNYLPVSLCVLSVSENSLTDINEVSYLCGLPNLEQLSITNNPCFMMTGENVGYDHRPFIINWCLHLRILDGYLVGPKESLKAEWLYSQGKGRHFRPGEHSRVVTYLSQVCPMTGADDLQTEEDAKLSRILNKQKQHQMQLLEELSRPPQPISSPILTRSTTTHSDQSPSPSLKRKQLRKMSPKSFSGVSMKETKQTSAVNLPNNAYNRYPVELPAGLYVLDMESHTRGNTEKSSNDQLNRPNSLFTKGGKTKSSVMVADLLAENLPGASGFRTETNYVPVPESMLSPDFRPVTTSPPALYGCFNGELRSHSSLSREISRPRHFKGSKSPIQMSRSPSHQGMMMNARPDCRKGIVSGTLIPQNSQGSPVRQQSEKKGTSASHQEFKTKSSFTDSPLLQRTANLRKLTRHRMLSVGPQRRKTLVQKMMGIDSTSSAESMSENDSTDSEIPQSKLVLVKGIAAARKSQKTTPRKLNDDAYVTEKENLEESEKLRKRQLSCQQRGQTFEVIEGEERNMESKLSQKSGVSEALAKQGRDDVMAVEKAATLIQATWKGFHTREYDPKVKKLKEEMRQCRAEDHISHLTQELRLTRQELAHERQLRSLQIDTIRALWKEVQLLQHVNSESLAKTSCLNTLGSSLNDLSISSPIYQSDIGQLFSRQSTGGKVTKSVQNGVQTDVADEDPLPNSQQQQQQKSSQKRGSGSTATTPTPLRTQPMEIPKVMSQSMPAYPSEVEENDHTTVMVKQLARTCEDLTNQIQHLHEALQVMSHIVFSPRGTASHQCYDPMTHSVSSEISACSCPSMLNSMIAQQMESLDSYVGPFPPSMMSSAVSVDGTVDFDSQGETISASLKFSPDQDESRDASSTPKNSAFHLQYLNSGNVKDDDDVTRGNEGHQINKIIDDDTPSPSDISKTSPQNAETNARVIRKKKVENGDAKQVGKKEQSPSRGYRPHMSKIGANIPGLVPRDRSKHDNGFQCGDAQWNAPPPQPPTTEAEESEDDCVITVQVMQAQVIEIQEVKVDKSPRNPEAPSLPVNHSGQGDDVRPMGDEEESPTPNESRQCTSNFDTSRQSDCSDGTCFSQSDQVEHNSMTESMFAPRNVKISGFLKTRAHLSL